MAPRLHGRENSVILQLWLNTAGHIPAIGLGDTTVRTFMGTGGPRGVVSLCVRVCMVMVVVVVVVLMVVVVVVVVMVVVVVVGRPLRG